MLKQIINAKIQNWLKNKIRHRVDFWSIKHLYIYFKVINRRIDKKLNNDQSLI